METYLMAMTFVVMVSTCTFVFAGHITRLGKFCRQTAKEIMGQATTAVDMTEEASVWDCKPMQVIPAEDGSFKLVDTK